MIAAAIESQHVSPAMAETWPNITEKQDAPADAEDWDGKPNKRGLLER